MSPLILVFLLVGTGLCAPVLDHDGQSLFDVDAGVKAVVGGNGANKDGKNKGAGYGNDNETNKQAILDAEAAAKAVVGGGSKGADKDCDKNKDTGKGNPFDGAPNDLEKTAKKETNWITKDSNGLEKETHGIPKDLNGVQKDTHGITKDIDEVGKQKDGAKNDADGAGKKAGKDCVKGEGLGNIGDKANDAIRSVEKGKLDAAKDEGNVVGEVSKGDVGGAVKESKGAVSDILEGDKGAVDDLLGGEKKVSGGDESGTETGGAKEAVTAAENEERTSSVNEVESGAEEDASLAEVDLDSLSL